MSDKNVLIVGGGPSGVRAALGKAEAGARVTIVEKFPTLGAERIPRDRLVSPEEAFANSDLEKVRKHPGIEILTYSEIKRLARENGRVRAKIFSRSLRVDNSKCTNCKACIKVCPVNMFDDFDEGLGFRTAVDYCNSITGEYNIYKEDMPVCQRACPVNLDIRSYVGLIADGNHAASLAKIRERLPLPGSIGRVCPHPCETACNRQYLDEPISICFLKRFVADVELSHGHRARLRDPEAKVPREDRHRRAQVLRDSPVRTIWQGSAMRTSRSSRPCPCPAGICGWAFPSTDSPRSSSSGRWISSATWG